MSTMNRLWNVSNPHQGDFKKVLCVCSAGLLRSPTLAWVLSNEPYNFNTRAVGVSRDYALVPMDEVHLQWADIVIAVEQSVMDQIHDRFSENFRSNQERYALNLPDMYSFRSPELIEQIHFQLGRIFPR